VRCNRPHCCTRSVPAVSTQHQQHVTLPDVVVHATAIVHAAGGAELHLQDRRFRKVWVAGHPSADIDPCRWRRFVCDRLDRLPGVETKVVAVGGRLTATTSGAFSDRMDPRLHWFVTNLCPHRAANVLREADLGGVLQDKVTATIRPDSQLGVTVVGLRLDAPDFEERLSELAITAIAACLVAELESA
jgi:hypothetical protein